MKKLIFITLLPLMLFWHGIALANEAEIERGIDAANAGNYKKAIAIWKPLAEQGNAKAQHNIGVMYHNGLGVAENFKEALKWYKKAAEQDFAETQFAIGYMYHAGHGVATNCREAKKWYRLAADQGNELAQEALEDVGC